jgi:hypothetical protein
MAAINVTPYVSHYVYYTLDSSDSSRNWYRKHFLHKTYMHDFQTILVVTKQNMDFKDWTQTLRSLAQATHSKINKFVYIFEYSSAFMLVLLILKKTQGSHKIKLGFKNYAIIMPIDIYCRPIKFDNKLNSMQRYDIPQYYRTLHREVQRLYKHNLKISHHGYIEKIRQRKQWFK